MVIVTGTDGGRGLEGDTRARKGGYLRPRGMRVEMGYVREDEPDGDLSGRDWLLPVRGRAERRENGGRGREERVLQREMMVLLTTLCRSRSARDMSGPPGKDRTWYSELRLRACDREEEGQPARSARRKGGSRRREGGLERLETAE